MLEFPVQSSPLSIPLLQCTCHIANECRLNQYRHGSSIRSVVKTEAVLIVMQHRRRLQGRARWRLTGFSSIEGHEQDLEELQMEAGRGAACFMFRKCSFNVLY